MLKHTQEELKEADSLIEDFYNKVITGLVGTFADPLARAEVALLRSFILYQNRKLKKPDEGASGEI